MISIAETLSRVQPHLSPALVPPHAYAAVHALAAQIPVQLSSWGYLECRLTDGDSRVDLVLRIDARGHEMLEGTQPALRLPPRLSADPYWRRLPRVAAPEAPSGPQRPASPGMRWLEFDIDPIRGSDVLEPGVFLGFGAPVAESGVDATARSDPLAAIAPLCNGRIRADVEQAVERCRAALPANAFIAYVGLFPHRDASAIRLCVAGLDHRSAPDYLSAVGWDGPEEELRACIGEIRRSRREAFVAEPTLLHLDVTAVVGERIGLEYVCEYGPQMRGAVAETAFLCHLDALGICSTAKREGLLAWPGYTVERLPHELWRSRVIRRLNHVKLVFGADAVPEAKAYLSFHHVAHTGR